jgi:uncharacterized protein (TIGR00297 family)
MYTHLPLILFVATGMVLSFWARKLTFVAAITGGVIAFLIYFTSGWAGIVMMSLFFILATIATSWNHRLKESFEVAEKNKGRRNAMQVIANAGVAGIISMMLLLFPAYSEIFILLIAASFSSATADTLSSEMGSVYGNKFYNILTWKKDHRGRDGVISAEGCTWGLAGSTIIAMAYAMFNSWDSNFIIIILAGTFGNLFDSFLGAAFERKGLIKNNTVNFLNTLFAAAMAWILWMIF